MSESHGETAGRPLIAGPPKLTRAASIDLALTDAYGVYMPTAQCHGCPVCRLAGLWWVTAVK